MAEPGPGRFAALRSAAVPDPGRSLIFAVLAPIWLVLVVRSWLVVDDAYIAFRFARNWARGHGVRFNLGDAVPVEGYSEFLWVAFGALLTRLGLDQVRWLPVAGVLAGLTLLWLLLGTARRLALGDTATAIVGLTFVAVPTSSVWATGGLATTAHALLYFLAVDRLALGTGCPPWLAGALGSALALVRVEGPAWAVVVVLVVLLAGRSRSPRGLTAFVGAAAATFALYEVWRWTTYGALVANTVTAKVDPDLSSLVRGARYAASFFLTSVVPLAAVPAAVVAAGDPRWRRPVAACGFAAGGALAYVVLAGGDFMAHFRLLLPVLPFVALLLGLGAQACLERAPAGFARAVVGALAAAGVSIAVLPAYDLHLLPRELRVRHEGARILDPEQQDEAVTSEQQHWQRMRARVEANVELGRALRRALPADASIVLSAVGAVGYTSHLRTVRDRNGLVERHAGGRRLAGRLPGHDFTLPLSAFLEDEPDVLAARLFPGGDICRRARSLVRGASFPGYAPVLTADRDGWLVTVRRVDDEPAAHSAFQEACASATREERERVQR